MTYLKQKNGKYLIKIADAALKSAKGPKNTIVHADLDIIEEALKEIIEEINKKKSLKLVHTSES